jgi:hypothetical protein
MRNLPGIVLVTAFVSSASIIPAPQNQALAFEVASIKLNTSPTSGGFIRPAGDRLTANNVPLKVLVIRR